VPVLEFKVVDSKRTEIVPGNEVLGINLKVSYAEFLSFTKHLRKPYRARFELPDGTTFEHNVGFGKGSASTAPAKITMRNYAGDIPEGTNVTILES